MDGFDRPNTPWGSHMVQRILFPQSIVNARVYCAKDFPLLPQLFYHSKRLSTPFRQLFRRSHDDPTIQKAPLSSAGKRQASSLL